MKNKNSIPDTSKTRKLVGLGVLLGIVFLVSVFLGRYPEPSLISPARLASDHLAQLLVLNIRLPRVIAAVLLGASLASAGLVFQMIFGNPLVEPGFLGVSQGASFGAALCIIFFINTSWAVQISAALCGLLGLSLSYLFARRVRFGNWVLRLVLAGIAVSALFSAGLGFLKFVADPLSQLPVITFWLLGSLASITWPQVISILPAVAIGLFIAFRMRWRLNLLSLNDETAFSLGAAPGRERALLLLAAVLATSAVISVSGMVSWVGLIIPHISRRLFGADARFVLIASILIGACFTLVCDDLARFPFASEIPLGILTSLIGAAIFILLMLRRNPPIAS